LGRLCLFFFPSPSRQLAIVRSPIRVFASLALPPMVARALLLLFFLIISLQAVAARPSLSFCDTLVFGRLFFSSPVSFFFFGLPHAPSNIFFPFGFETITMAHFLLLFHRLLPQFLLPPSLRAHLLLLLTFFFSFMSYFRNRFAFSIHFCPCGLLHVFFPSLLKLSPDHLPIS